MRVEIRTSDTAWADAHGAPGRDGRTVVSVPAVTADRFAGQDMVRFDLRQIAPRTPSDYPNPWVMVPQAWAV